MDDATVVEYSLIVDVAMDGLHACLDSDTFVVGKRGHRSSIGGINDASSYIIMEKVSPQSLPIVSISSEAHDLGYQSKGYWRVGGVRPAIRRSLFEFGELSRLGACCDRDVGNWSTHFQPGSFTASLPAFGFQQCLRWSSVASRLRRADGTDDI